VADLKQRINNKFMVWSGRNFGVVLCAAGRAGC
jgi:hypothetical protein